MFLAISKSDTFIKAAKEAPIPINLHEMVWGYIQLSNCYLNLKQIDISFATIEKAIALASVCQKNNHGVKPLLECQSFKILLYIQSNKKSEAAALAKMNLKFAEETLSNNNPEIVKPLMDLAYCQEDDEKTTTVQLLQRVLAILDKVKWRHPEYCKASWRLVHIYLSTNEVNKGIELAERVYNELTLVEEIVNTNPLLYGDGKKNSFTSYLHCYLTHFLIAVATLLQCHLHCKNYEKSIELSLKLLTYREKGLGEKHPLVGNVMATLGELYEQQGDINNAEPMFTRAYVIMKDAFGAGDPKALSIQGKIMNLQRKNSNKVNEASRYTCLY